MRLLLHRFLLPIAAAVLLQGVAQGQSSASGSVVDPGGSVVPDYELRLESTEGVVVQQTVTDKRGHFRLNNVAPGDYTLIAPPARGFAEAIVPVHIGNGPVQTIDIHLNLDQVVQRVEVASESTSVAAYAGANSDQVGAGSTLIEKIPVLSQDIVGTFTPFLNQTGVGTNGVVIVVDGIEMKGTGVSASAIKSVNINNDPYSAESNRPGKGRIEILTKAGTPKVHGDFNFTFRDATLDAANPFAVKRPVEQRRIYEGNITGPLSAGGKTTFLLSGTRQEDDLESIVYASGIDGTISANVPTPTHTTLFAARAARELSANHRMSLQYNVDDVVANNQGVGGLVLESAGVNSQTREDDVIFNDGLTIGTHLVNQFQFFLEKDHNPVRSATDAQKIVVDGAFTEGGAQANVLDTENNGKINDIVSWTHGKHFLKTGIVIPNLSRRAWEDHANRLGTFKFASLADYAAHQPYAYTQETGPGRAVFWANELGIFLQDQIQLRPCLQISLGLRYDWQTYFDSYHDFAPRVSIAYSPDKEHKTVFRAGAGVFYDRSGARPISELKRFNGKVIRSITILNPDYTNPILPGQDISLLPTDLITLAPDVSLPLLLHYSLGMDRQIAKGATVALTYRGNFGANLFRSADANAPLGPDYSARPNPALGVARQIQSRGQQVSNALDVTFKANSSRWFNGLVQYTLSHTENNTGGIAWFPANQYDDSGEYARANFDQLQRFNLLGTLNEGHWLSLGVASNLYSGTPYSETSGVDNFQTGLLNERPAGVGRNSLTTGGYANLDLRWSHDFAFGKVRDKGPAVSFTIDAFNILNRTNYSTYVGNVQSGLFRQPVSALPARRLQFTARFRF
jgi:hypothetical protein